MVEGHHNSSFKKVAIIVAVFIVILAAISVYYTFYTSYECKNFECFKSAMESCNKVSYINEEPQASWGYNIIGTQGTDCTVDVKLLQAKQGELGIEAFIGHDMRCYYNLGESAYPEKDLTKCHGLLKEDLQGIIINKLHAYIIENLGQFNQSLNSIS